MAIRQAVIVAAGRGKRMKANCSDAEILDLPKPLLFLNGIPIIEHTIIELESAGINVAVIVNSSDEDIFRRKLSSHNITYLRQDEPLGTGNALFQAKDFITDDLFLVCSGDDIIRFGMDLSKICDPTVFSYQVSNISGYGKIILDDQGYASEVREKRDSGKGMVNTGSYVMSIDFFDRYSEIRRDSFSNELFLTEMVRILYESGKPMRVAEVEFWKGINTPKELYEARKLLSGSDITIRAAIMSDMEDIILLMRELSPDNDSVVEHSRKAEVLSSMLDNKDYSLLIAVKDGNTVGTGLLMIQQNLSHGCRPYGHIENIVVSAKCRGMGLGKEIVKTLVRIAKLHNCYKVILDCAPHNSAFYQKIGFMSSGEIEMRMNL